MGESLPRVRIPPLPLNLNCLRHRGSPRCTCVEVGFEERASKELHILHTNPSLTAVGSIIN